MAVQAIAAIYFAIDGFGDIIGQMRTGLTLEIVMECIIAFALAAGVAIGVAYVMRLVADLRR